MDERDARGGADVGGAEPGAEVRVGNGLRSQVVRVRRDGWTKARRQAFLDTLAQTCNVTMATQAAGMSNNTAYNLRKADPVFARLWQEALALGYDRLETALLRQALIGVNALSVGGEDMPGATANAAPAGALPGSGIAPGAMTPVQVQVALAVLNRRDAAVRRDGAPRGLRRATLADAEKALAQGIAMLARDRARKANALPAPRDRDADGAA